MHPVPCLYQQGDSSPPPFMVLSLSAGRHPSLGSVRGYIHPLVSRRRGPPLSLAVGRHKPSLFLSGNVSLQTETNEESISLMIETRRGLHLSADRDKEGCASPLSEAREGLCIYVLIDKREGCVSLLPLSVQKPICQSQTPFKPFQYPCHITST